MPETRTSSGDTNNCGFIVTSVPVLTTIEVEILKRFGDFTKSIKRRLVVKQGLKPSRLLSKGGARDTNNCGFIVTSVPVLTTIEVKILKRFGDFTKSIKRCLVVKQRLKPSRLLSKGVFEHLHAAHDAPAAVPGGDGPRGGGTPLRAGNGSTRRSSATTRWQRARRQHTRRTRHGMASGPGRRSGSRRSCGVHCPGSARPRRASYRRSWRGKQPPSKRTSANCAHSWRLTASAPSKPSGAATPLTSPSAGKLCGGP